MNAPAAGPAVDLAAAQALQRRRQWTRWSFFTLFVLAPPLDLFRLDLDLGHFIFLGQPWRLRLADLASGEVSAGTMLVRLLLLAFLPLALLVGGVLWTAWRHGRLYCGWLCPHFSVVELINGLMRRASGRPTLWERAPLPPLDAAGGAVRVRAWMWLPTALAVGGFAFLWALTLLCYLQNPEEIYAGLLGGGLTRNQGLFLCVATAVFSADFLLARHLFCRFGCAVGLFQSIAWMANRRALVVGFDGARAAACAGCHAACDAACPMRLKPRTIKRRMFTCTQCAQCVQACAHVQRARPEGGLLRWVRGQAALGVCEPRSVARAQQRREQVETVEESARWKSA